MFWLSNLKVLKEFRFSPINSSNTNVKIEDASIYIAKQGNICFAIFQGFITKIQNYSENIKLDISIQIEKEFCPKSSNTTILNGSYIPFFAEISLSDKGIYINNGIISSKDSRTYFIANFSYFV